MKSGIVLVLIVFACRAQSYYEQTRLWCDTIQERFAAAGDELGMARAELVQTQLDMVALVIANQTSAVLATKIARGRLGLVALQERDLAERCAQRGDIPAGQIHLELSERCDAIVAAMQPPRKVVRLPDNLFDDILATSAQGLPMEGP